MKFDYKRYILFLFGICILTLGVSLTVKSDLGAGSYDSINFAIANILNIKVSFAIGITSLIILLLSAIVRKSFPKIITFLTAIIMGIFIDLWVNVTNIIVINTLLGKIFIFTIGIILLCIGISLYLIPKLPVNPMDDFMIALTEKNISIKKSKISIDATCILIAFLLNAQIGLGTILLTFLVGPLVDVFYKFFSKYINFNNEEECEIITR